MADNGTLDGESYDISRNVVLANEGIGQINIIVDRTWCCRLNLSSVLVRPMRRHLTSCVISERPAGSA